MIPYIGDISSFDALVLKKYAESEDVHSILEFGCGASTQVIAAYTKAKFLSIDTSQEWIDKTKRNIKLLEINNMPDFMLYDDFDFSGRYDFVFDDGVDYLREPFAKIIWSCINVNGMLAFHDTRRPGDLDVVLNFISFYRREVNAVLFNYNESNISIIYKGIPKDYYDWQVHEKRLLWQGGTGEPDENFIKELLRKNG